MNDIETLIEAVKAGDEARVRMIVAEHPRSVAQRLPSGESPLMAALYRGHHNVVTALIQLGAELDVFAAAAIGDLDCLTRDLKRPDVVNAYAYDGWTALHLAAFFGQLEAARLLIEAGADLEALSRNNLANTPLHAATAGKHEGMAMLLLERGADPCAIDAGGCTPVTIARENQLQEFLSRASDLGPRTRTPANTAAGSER